MDRYDKAYFDKWYRDPAHRVSTPAMTRRKAALALAMAEYYLERSVRTVLDVACGEGQWQPVLARLRPGIRYTGVDPSAYAVTRFGARRNLLRGSFGELDMLPLAPAYDLIVCSNALYYVPEPELAPGLRAIAARLDGVAFLEAYANEEGLTGDTGAMEPRDVAFYQRLFRRAGLVSCGSHCYVGETLSNSVTALERGGIGPRAPR
jgi:SAM-dependent methyltransferase